MKLMQKGIWSQIKQGKIFTKVFWKAILPILLYILFSISNIVFLTMAMHDIPASIAYAVGYRSFNGYRSGCFKKWL
jgi:multidrug transporter EmrE-like cation transporter